LVDGHSSLRVVNRFFVWGKHACSVRE
jgi:hypothetical protein